MTTTDPRVHEDLPRTNDIVYPPTRTLERWRPAARQILQRRWRITVEGTANVPADGPVVIAANHIGILDGPLMGILTPRPVHALTKSEMFEGRARFILRASGQIPVVRHTADPRAIRTCVRILRDGGVTGIFPEGTRGAGDLAYTERGAAYLGLVTGAVVVPLGILGTRKEGGPLSSVPHRGARIALTFGEPVRLQQQPWPRTKTQVGEAHELVLAGLRDTLRQAQEQTGISLPGPIPPLGINDAETEVSP